MATVFRRTVYRGAATLYPVVSEVGVSGGGGPGGGAARHARRPQVIQLYGRGATVAILKLLQQRLLLLLLLRWKAPKATTFFGVLF